MKNLSAERERGLRLYTCLSCSEEFPLKAGLLCPGGGPAGERHFLCGSAFGSGCADGYVVSRCGGLEPHRSAPDDLVHLSAASNNHARRTLGVRCSHGGAGCALFEDALLLPALLPATCNLYRATLFELERDAAKQEAERSAKIAADTILQGRLAEQAVRSSE